MIPKGSDFYEVVGQIYRGEVSRANTYRKIMDIPTNWGVAITTFLIGARFGFEGSSKFLPLIGIPVLLFLLKKEIHRTRKYHSALTRAKSLDELMLKRLEGKNVGVLDVRHALNYDKTDVSILSITGNRFFHNYFILFLLLILAYFL